MPGSLRHCPSHSSAETIFLVLRFQQWRLATKKADLYEKKDEFLVYFFQLAIFYRTSDHQSLNPAASLLSLRKSEDFQARVYYLGIDDV